MVLCRWKLYSKKCEEGSRESQIFFPYCDVTRRPTLLSETSLIAVFTVLLAHAFKCPRLVHGGFLSIVAILAVACRTTGVHSKRRHCWVRKYSLRTCLGCLPFLGSSSSWSRPNLPGIEQTQLGRCCCRVRWQVTEDWFKVWEKMWTSGRSVRVGSSKRGNCPTAQMDRNASYSFVLLRLVQVRCYLKLPGVDHYLYISGLSNCVAMRSNN